jgi:hypothetical protein
MNAYRELVNNIGQDDAYSYAPTLQRRQNNPGLTQAIAILSDRAACERLGRPDIAASLTCLLQALPLNDNERRILATNYTS